METIVARPAAFFRLAPLALAGVGLAGCQSPPETVSRALSTSIAEPARPVDLSKFVGRWRELGRIDAGVASVCEAVTSDFTPLASGRFRIVSTCRLGGVEGPTQTITGEAAAVSDRDHAKLTVTLDNPFGGKTSGDYWILDHGSDYRWAIVGEPTGKALWILTRETQTGDAYYADLLARAQSFGFDVSKARRTQHPDMRRLTTSAERRAPV